MHKIFAIFFICIALFTGCIFSAYATSIEPNVTEPVSENETTMEQEEVTTEESATTQEETDSSRLTGTGMVMFTAVVSSEVNNITPYITVVIENEAGKTMSCDIYRDRGWVLSVTLPVGKYTVVDGGVPNDTTNKYPIDLPLFYINENSITISQISCGLSYSGAIVDILTTTNNQTTDITEEQTTIKQENTTVLVTDAHSSALVTSDKSNTSYGTFIIFGVCIVGVLAVFTMKKLRQNKQN